jgi:RNA polymerase sigma-70 factor, ECF subfamily
MSAEGHETVTVLLRKWSAGDKAAHDQLIELVYPELRRIAEVYMAGERKTPTFSMSDLVNEAYLRLANDGDAGFNDRAHFFAVAARHMRQILVDRARKRYAQKRGGGERPVTFTENAVPYERPEELIALDEALETLKGFDERKARAVEMAYFAGMTQDEIAAALGVHLSTVARELRLAVAWLNEHLDANE